LKAIVIHHTLNSAGGESSFAIETMRCLSKLGYEIELITVQKPDMKLLSSRYGGNIAIKNIKYISPFKINYLGIYQRILTLLATINVGQSDIVINTNGNSLPFNIPQNILCILYIHFPAILQTKLEYSNTKYKKSLAWRAYFKPYQIMTHILTKKALKRANLIFTNSKFSQNAIKKAYPSFDPCVIYPPVDIEPFSKCHLSNSRENQVLVISRFSPEKQLEKAILIARILKDTKFSIIGSLLKTNQSYFKFLQHLINDFNLTERINLIPNASKDEMISEMSNSMVYLHTMNGEHFGISIVEAMGAGLIPIVPSFGGCSEIVPPEYRYNNIMDAARCISKHINSHDSKKKQLLLTLAKQFSPDNFRLKMRRFIEEAYNKGSSLQQPHSYSILR
jgi:glycosyltransferase involved in cell wall biosynthesis